MSSNAVTRMISKIQFTIFSLFAFIFSIIIIAFTLLSYGVSVPLVILPHVKAKQLYIKLDEKLIFHAKSISVTTRNSDDNDDSLLPIPVLSPFINFARRNFQSFIIDELNIDGRRVTFRYTDRPANKDDNSIILKSSDIDASVFYRIYESHMVFDMPFFIHKPSTLRMTAKAVHDFSTNETFSTSTLSLTDCATIQLYTKNNAQALAFTASSDIFYDLAPIVDLFGLEESTEKWIIERNDASSYQLLHAKGIYAYTDPHMIMRTLSIHAKETDVKYTFNPLIPPITSEEVDVYFAQGRLDIVPSDPEYDEHMIDRGEVTIDFNPKHIMLTVDLNIDTTLDQGIVDLLKAYDITLPLLQEDGTTKTDLNIAIDLFTEEASVVGHFLVTQSDLLLDGVRYKIKDASVRLNRSFLSIDTAKIAYGDIFSAEVNGNMDLQPMTGDFFFDVENVSLPLSKDSTLDLLSKDLRVQLYFSKDTESFILPASIWSYNDINISIDENTLSMPEKFSSVTTFNDVGVSIDNLVSCTLSGSYDTNNSYADIDINATHLHYQSHDFNLSTLDAPLDFHLVRDDNQTVLNSMTGLSFMINDKQLKIMPTSFFFQGDYLDINNTFVAVDDVFSTNISSHYQLGSKKATVLASNTMLFNDEILFLEPSFELSYESTEGQQHIDIDAYDIHATFNDKKEISIAIKDFAAIYPYSKMMQLYEIKSGQANVTIIGDSVGIDMTLTDFYPLLSKNGTNITDYNVKGIYTDATANLQINKDIELLYKDKGELSAKNIDFNLFPILEYIKNIHTNGTDDEKSDLDLTVNTSQCNVSLGDSGRKIIADTIAMQIKADTISAQLVHGNGGVIFESEDTNISVFGRNLNDTFMNRLFKFSTFKGGDLSFVMHGPYDDMEGIININKTVIKDYTILNNTLAFFNTIPSLVTFSVPHYSKSGLKVDTFYSSFHKHGPKIEIKDTKLTSKELIITALGESDVEKDEIDILLQVKSDLGSSAKDIPLLGYLIFGDDSVSTTVRVHGPLDDPKVENSVAKSIIAAPFNIIKRTLTLPFMPFGIFDDDDNTTDPEK